MLAEHAEQVASAHIKVTFASGRSIEAAPGSGGETYRSHVGATCAKPRRPPNCPRLCRSRRFSPRGPAIMLTDADARRWLPMVRHLAARYARRLPAHIELCDLESAGRLGLVQALLKGPSGDPAHFPKYVARRIRGAILDELRSRDFLPRDRRQDAKKVDAARSRLGNQLGRDPTEQETAEALGWSLERYRDIAALAVLVSSELDDIASVDDVLSVEEQLIRAEQARPVIAAVHALPERLRALLDLYYQQGETLAAIGERLGVTESRACQLHQAAIALLRETMRGKF